MNDRYIFDKRVLKKHAKKYGLIFLAIFPILLLFNYAIRNVGLNSNSVMWLDALVAGVLVGAIELVLYQLRKWKKQAEQNSEMLVDNKPITNSNNNKSKGK